jgi:hypothetical protein
MGLQTPSAPSVPSSTPPLGTVSSVPWLAASICLCICQALAEALRKQPYQAPVSKHFPTSTIASGFGDCMWDGSSCGAVSRWPFLQSLLHTVSKYSTVNILFPFLRRNYTPTLWSSFFLSLMWCVNCNSSIPSF